MFKSHVKPNVDRWLCLDSQMIYFSIETTGEISWQIWLIYLTKCIKMSIINVNACCVTVAESYCLRSTDIFLIEISEIV